MYPNSIQEGETKIFQLVMRSSQLQAELAQVQINSQSAENELQMQFFAEERKRLMDEIDTTQRSIVCLDRWIRDERVKETHQQPRSISCAKDEISTLIPRIADLRARIESIDSRGLACANLIAERRWMSSRLDFLKRWIDEQITLPEGIEIPKDVTKPRSIEGAQSELNRLPHETKVLITRFEDMSISDNTYERVRLLLQIKSKEARNDFLAGWISQTRKAQFQEIVEQVESISSDEPTSHSEAQKQCERLSRLSMSTQSRIRRLCAEDDTELRRYLGRLQKEADERIGWLKEWIRMHKPTKVAKAQNPPPVILAALAKVEPESMQSAVTERDNLISRIESNQAAGSYDEQTLNRLRQRKNFLTRWISQFRDKSGNQFAGFDLVSTEGILYAVDSLIGQIEKDHGGIIYQNPDRVDVWNALRKKIGFKQITSHNT